MVFCSLEFLCFFLPGVIIGYHVLFRNHVRLQNYFLLLASLLFYAYGNVEYLWLLLLVIAIAYIAGGLLHRIGRNERLIRYRIPVLIAALAICFMLLIGYKYLGFLLGWFNRLTHTRLSIPSIVLPIGISFFIFQSTSYIIDVYRDECATLRGVDGEGVYQSNPLLLALYISFFPQLIAGPIVRYTDIQKSLTQRSVSRSSMVEGINLFVIGLAKKVLLSNVVGETATQIMLTNRTMIDQPTAFLGIVCYTLQIYYDFSGYSDMAIGMGKMFGFQFPENFDHPYASQSITQFWRKWHMTLSGWFRDYVYIPLGGSRKGNVYLHLFIVFMLTGIWHGAATVFLVWGLWNGLFIIAERFVNRHIKAKPRPWLKPFRWLYTICVVMIGWVFFNSDSMSNAIAYLSVLTGIKSSVFVRFSLSYYLDNRLLTVLVFSIAGSFPLKDYLQKKDAMRKFFQTTWYMAFRCVCSLALLILCLICICNGSYNPFIYFRF